MTTIIRKHLFAILLCLAIIFLVVLIGLYAWGIGYLAQVVNQSNNEQSTGDAAPQFNLGAAAQLDYHGIAVLLLTTSTASSTSQ